MPFESKPLRVHLHCDTNASVIERLHQTVCVYVNSIPPTYCEIPSVRPCDYFFSHPGRCGYFVTFPPCRGVSLPDCGPDSGIVGEPGTPQEWVRVQHDDEDPTRITIRLEDLPTYVKALDDELRRHEEIAERKGEIEERLEEARALMKEAREAAGGEAAAGEQTEA